MLVRVNKCIYVCVSVHIRKYVGNYEIYIYVHAGNIYDLCCVHACVYVFDIYVCVYVYNYLCIYTWIYVCTYVRIHLLCMHVYM